MIRIKYFPEYWDMWQYCRKHGITEYSYRFTFQHGYELITKEEMENVFQRPLQNVR